MSNLEALNLEVKAGHQGFLVGKRLGLDKNAVITSAGPIKIGSLFCMMRNLPDRRLGEFTSLAAETGVILNAESDVLIDSLQGVANLKS